MVGTLLYIAPEQINGRGTDFRSDIYTLGISLFEAVTGRLPFERRTDYALMHAHVQEAPPRPKQFQRSLPPELEWVILKAIEKNPDRRFQSAAQFRDALLTLTSRYRAQRRSLPDSQTLFEGADLTAPEEAAETVLANMLLEVMYSVSRFSPWYKKPLGLRRIYDEATDRSRWALSPKTCQQWQELLKPLSIAIKSNVSVMLAADLLESMEGGTLPADRVMATCLCVPPRLIRVNRAVLMNAGIVCDTCRQPFRPVEMPDAGIEE
jgi:serine/threonine protein kinase